MYLDQQYEKYKEEFIEFTKDDIKWTQDIYRNVRTCNGYSMKDLKWIKFQLHFYYQEKSEFRDILQQKTNHMIQLKKLKNTFRKIKFHRENIEDKIQQYQLQNSFQDLFKISSQ